MNLKQSLMLRSFLLSFFLQKPEIHIDNQKFSFKGISKESNQEYAVELEFYGEIDPEVRISWFGILWRMYLLLF
jgi:hypothetical protein